jgi:F-type H+-transporting ATPase subunit b
MAAPDPDTQAASLHTELANEAHQGNAFQPFDAHNFVPQLIWLVLVFGLLYWLMSRVALPRVASILEARRHRLAQDLDDAAAMQNQAKAAGEAYDQTLADARGRAQGLAQATHDKLHAESEAKRHTLEAELNGKLAVAEQQIGETKTRAMASVAGIAADTAASLIEHLTGRRPDAEAVRSAVSTVQPS